MVWHLENDPDLIAALAQNNDRVHSEAARRAIRKFPRDDDLDATGEPLEKATDRLVTRFMRECSFALSDEEDDPFASRGFDEGYWTNRQPPKPRRPRKSS
jgi:hypothetical protein